MTKRNNKRAGTQARRRASAARARRAEAKLSMQIAREIRADDRCAKQWARELGCDKSMIFRIRANKAWVELSNPFAGLMKA